MEKIIIAAICIVSFLFCLTGLVIGFWTAIKIFCEGLELKKIHKQKKANEVHNELKYQFKYDNRPTRERMFV